MNQEVGNNIMGMKDIYSGTNMMLICHALMVMALLPHPHCLALEGRRTGHKCGGYHTLVHRRPNQVVP